MKNVKQVREQETSYGKKDPVTYKGPVFNSWEEAVACLGEAIALNQINRMTATDISNKVRPAIRSGKVKATTDAVQKFLGYREEVDGTFTFSSVNIGMKRQGDPLKKAFRVLASPHKHTPEEVTDAIAVVREYVKEEEKQDV